MSAGCSRRCLVGTWCGRIPHYDGQGNVIKLGSFAHEPANIRHYDIPNVLSRTSKGGRQGIQQSLLIEKGQLLFLRFREAYDKERGKPLSPVSGGAL